MLTNVFEIRKKIIEAYGKYEYIIVPAFKFAVAFLLILMINNHIGFNLGLTNKLLGVIIALICTLVPESRAPVGSSARRISGLLTSARAMATRCICPPDI